MSLSRVERETILRFSEDPEDSCTFETFNERHAKRLLASGAKLLRESERDGWRYWSMSFPKGWFRWPRPSRKLTGVALDRAVERARGLRGRAASQGDDQSRAIQRQN